MNQVNLTGKVAADALNLRASPGGVVLRVLRRGSDLDILNRTGNWLQVSIGGYSGFVSSQYVRINPAAEEKSSVPDKTGTVNTPRLNLRVEPNGTIIGQLAEGKTVGITGEEDGWLSVTAEGLSGYVKSEYVTFKEQSSIPPPEKDEDIAGLRLAGNEALAPDGTCFAKKFKAGFFGYGSTSIDSFVRNNAHRFADKSESMLRIIRAVSENEGKYEAINTWDNAFLSFGIFQWTSGAGSTAGELPAVLQRLGRDHPDTFEACFGRYGLTTTGVTSRTGLAPVGYFSLNNVLLATVEAKSTLRSLPWAYRFWSAGHDDNVREVQTIHAMERIDLFYRNERWRIRGFYVGDYITSECGVALLLDQHVNRPGHVPATLAKATDALANEIDMEHPERWGKDEEGLLLKKYLELRSRTSMTDSESRAGRILKKVSTGSISDQRNSYVL
ncbi:MAG: SH3 domain-containing protein [Deltaproteobacteria bacterium]|nr:SH3 domain-containing protein [Deltaproteobacteria bacterium]